MSERNGHIFNAGFALAIAIVLSSIVGAWAYTQSKHNEQTVTVTGSARKRIKSDLIVWKVGISYQGDNLADAYKALKERVPKVKKYLMDKGVTENQITISSVSTRTLHAKSSDGETETGRITGYAMSQQIEVRSNDVEKISRLSREVTELIDQGILLESNAPQYLYTKLGDLKIEMLGEAAKDAKVRAQQVAVSTGSKIGSVRAAKMGVLQITPADSNEVSGEGMNDTTSLEKDITAVVNVSFAVE